MSTTLKLSPGKQRGLRALSDSRGVIAALAIDRTALRSLFARAMGTESGDVPAPMLVDFKTAVSQALTPHASAAREKAKTMAAELGQTLGKPWEIREEVEGDGSVTANFARQNVQYQMPMRQEASTVAVERSLSAQSFGLVVNWNSVLHKSW